jgi:hypothetical protein
MALVYLIRLAYPVFDGCGLRLLPLMVAPPAAAVDGVPSSKGWPLP